MKRTQRILETAEEVGWLAEFPEELWQYMILYLLGEMKEGEKIAFMLVMINTCTMFYRILHGPIIMLLCDFVGFDAVYADKKTLDSSVKTPSVVRMCEVFNMIESQFDPREYLRGCLVDDAYKTIEHHSNCLSLLHLAELEACHLCTTSKTTNRHDETYRARLFYEVNVDVAPFQELGDIYYFDAVTMETSCLKDRADVRVLQSISHTLYDQAMNIANSKRYGDHLWTMLLHINPVLRESISFLVETIVTAGEAPRTKPMKVHGDRFENVVITIGNKQHYIYSEAARSFREQCCVINCDEKKLTHTRFMLAKLHQRNWDIVTNSGRYVFA